MNKTTYFNSKVRSILNGLLIILALAFTVSACEKIPFPDDVINPRDGDDGRGGGDDNGGDDGRGGGDDNGGDDGRGGGDDGGDDDGRGGNGAGDDDRNGDGRI